VPVSERWRHVIAGRRPATDPPLRWDRGSSGEERLAHALERLAARGLAAPVIHGAQAPDGGSTVDHVVVTRNGIWVVTAVHDLRAVEVHDIPSAPGRPGGPCLLVGDTVRTDLLDGARAGAEPVAAVLAGVPAAAEVAVRAALCFVDAGHRVRGGAHDLHGVLISGEGHLLRRLRAPGPLDERARRALWLQLAGRLVVPGDSRTRRARRPRGTGL
jgi:hypothetical protein